jgi:hypothetical protein
MITDKFVHHYIRALAYKLEKEDLIKIPSFKLVKNNKQSVSMQTRILFRRDDKKIVKRELIYNIKELNDWKSVLPMIVLHEFGHLVFENLKTDIDSQIDSEYKAEKFGQLMGRQLFPIESAIWMGFIKKQLSNLEYCHKNYVHTEAWKRLLSDE